MKTIISVILCISLSISLFTGCNKEDIKTKDHVLYTHFADFSYTGTGGYQLRKFIPGEEGTSKALTEFQESNVSNINISPDGSMVVFRELFYGYAIIRIIGITNNKDQHVVDESGGSLPDFIDNKTVAYFYNNQIIQCDLDGGNQEVLFEDTASNYFHTFFRVSPDGLKAITLEAVHKKGALVYNLVCINFTDNQKHVLASEEQNVEGIGDVEFSLESSGYPFFGPNSNYVYYNCDYTNSYDSDISPYEGFYRIKTDSTGKEKLIGRPLYYPSLTKSEKIIHVYGGIRLMELDGSADNVIYDNNQSDNPLYISMAVMTPYSNHIVFGARVNETSAPAMYTITKSGSDRKKYDVPANLFEMAVYNGF